MPLPFGLGGGGGTDRPSEGLGAKAASRAAKKQREPGGRVYKTEWKAPMLPRPFSSAPSTTKRRRNGDGGGGTAPHVRDSRSGGRGPTVRPHHRERRWRRGPALHRGVEGGTEQSRPSRPVASSSGYPRPLTHPSAGSRAEGLPTQPPRAEGAGRQKVKTGGVQGKEPCHQSA
jgi:hypothetical protein